MTATTRGSPVGGNDSQGQAPDGQSQPPLQQNQVGHLRFYLKLHWYIYYEILNNGACSE